MRGGLNVDVLNDVNEKDFDRAFNLIRPVIQGTGDIGVNKDATTNKELNEKELSDTMDFVFRLFSHGPQDDHDHPDDGLHGNVSDLDKDARARLAALSKHIAYSMGHDGVKHILEDAREKMRLAVIGKTAVEFTPIAAPA